MNDRRSGLLLFAHGARDTAWALPFQAVARRCAERRPEQPVALAFLEFMTPNLLEAGAVLAGQGCTEVDVVPLFLGAGGHVRKDIPMLLDALIARHPAVRWRLQPTVGESPELIETLAHIALSASNPTSTAA
jgi:sirohydrochlorin cobaltochelatase